MTNVKGVKGGIQQQIFLMLYGFEIKKSLKLCELNHQI